MLSLCTGYAAPLPETQRVQVSGDPSIFTIGVNMQHPSLAAQYAAAGINQFVGVDWPVPGAPVPAVVSDFDLECDSCVYL